jgi:hypothetical protein
MIKPDSSDPGDIWQGIKSTARVILKNLMSKRAKKTFEKRGIQVDFDMPFVGHILEWGFSRGTTT